MKTRSMCKAERLSVDRISTLPQPILETILSLLPTEEAARTSILSREWRYKWTTIPKLRFTLRNTTSELTSDIASTREKMDMNGLHQVLLLRQGPIHELSLSMQDYWEHYDCFEFDQIILHLSRNHAIKKLTLNGLRSEDICLGSLYLKDVKISTKSLLHLLSNCPSLKSLDIGELDDKCTTNELLKCLPVIAHLTISTRYFKWLVLDPVPQELPTSLIHLKYLRLEGMCIDEDYRLAFHILIKCSPNLERFELEVDNIQQILLLRQGPIYELTLQLPVNEDAGLELDPIVSHLSRNHMVKKLKLYRWDALCGYGGPISIFSFHHLRDLDISDAELYHPPIFNGFASLESLSLRDVVIPKKTLLHLLLNCPSLKSFCLHVLSYDKCTINELLECLPVIEHLNTSTHISEWVVLNSVPQEHPTSLNHLRYLCFKDTSVEHCGLAYLLVFIKCSPNLEIIKLESDWGHCYKDYSFEWEEYSDVWLEHLHELDFDCFNNLKPEMDFVKFILARSPKLKKVSILSDVGKSQNPEILKTLLQAPHVSQVVITVN
ncbi:putative F-box domain, leucine-rich repeat domain superfamily, F-box-like domain superfamily [Helianthus debilis subsp. tardiflorus]